MLKTRISPLRRMLAGAAVAGCAVVACGRSDERAASAKPTAVASASGDSILKDSIARARQDSINRAQPGYVIDSILPIEEELRRFSAKIGGAPVTALQDGVSSRDSLIRRFVVAVASGDSSALRAMAVNAREFADLVYPESPNTKPPYQQDPALVWRTIQNPSQSGFIRLVRRAGGHPVKLVSYQCDPKPGRQGKNTFWTGCTLLLAGPDGVPSRHRFFGTILERDGRFKFLSFRNEF